MLSEDAVAIMNRVLVTILEPGGFAQLLQSSSGSRMCGDVVMNQAVSTVLDYHEHVRQAEGGSDDDHKIASEDALGVQAQEGRPSFSKSSLAIRFSPQQGFSIAMR